MAETFRRNVLLLFVYRTIFCVVFISITFYKCTMNEATIQDWFMYLEFHELYLFLCK